MLEKKSTKKLIDPECDITLPSKSDISINFKLNGIHTFGIVDSGSDICLITSKLLDRIDSKWKPVCVNNNANSIGTGVGGHTFKIQFTLLRLEVGGQEKEILFAVADINSGDILLGLPFIKLFNIRIEGSGNKICIYSNNTLLSSPYNTKDIFYFKDCNYTKKHLCPKQFAEIKIKIPFKLSGEYILESFDDNRVVPVVLDLNNQDSFAIIIYNNKDKPVDVKKHSINITLSFLSNPTNKIERLEDIEPKTLISYLRTTDRRLFETSQVRCGSNSVHKFYKLNSNDCTDCKELMSSSECDEYMYNSPGLDIVPNLEPFNFEQALNEQLDPSLTGGDREFVSNLFKRYKSLIPKFCLDVGTFTDFRNRPIHLDVPLKAPVPQNTRSYATSNEDNLLLNDCIEFLVHYKLAKECSHVEQFGSPVFLQKSKLNRAPRLLIDIRSVNRVIDAFTSTPAENILQTIRDVASKGRYVTSIDISKAYHSIRLSPSALKSGISNLFTQKGAFKLLIAPTGLNILPIFFRHNLNKQMSLNDNGHFKPIRNIRLWYDDIFLFTKDRDSHKTALTQLLHRLARSGLKVSLSKCKFFVDIEKTELEILGHKIFQGAISPKETKLFKSINFKPPSSRRELQGFLGHINFLRDILPLSVPETASVLCNLTSEKVPFKWREVHKEAFETIKDILNNIKSDLSVPTDNQINIIYTDSSERSIGGLCIQVKLTSQFYENIPPDVLSLSTLNPALKHFEHFNLNIALLHSDLQCQETGYKSLSSQLKLFLDKTENPEPKCNINVGHEIHKIIYLKMSQVKQLFNDEREVTDFYNSALNFSITSTYERSIEFLLHLITILIKKGILLIIVNDDRENRRPFVKINYFDYPTYIVLLYHAQSDTYSIGFMLSEYKYEDVYIPPSTYRVMDEHNLLKTFERNVKNGDIKGNALIVGRFHKCLDKAEVSKPIHTKEILAVMFSLNKFKDIIYSSNLTLLATDSRVGYHLFHPEIKDSGKRISRFALKLQTSYPMVKLLNISGKNNVADFLTRLNFDKGKFFANSFSPVKINHESFVDKNKMCYSWSELYSLCRDNPEVITFTDKKLNVLESNNAWLDSGGFTFLSIKSHLDRVNFFESFTGVDRVTEEQYKIDLNVLKSMTKYGDLYGNDNKVFIPDSLIPAFILRTHFFHGHPGDKKLRVIFKKQYYILNISKVNTTCTVVSNSCVMCMVHNDQKTRKIPQGVLYSPIPNKVIQADLIESLPGDLNILTIVECYSGYVNLYVLNSKTSRSVIHALLNHFSVFSCPSVMVTDNASIFRSYAFKKFLSLLKIKMQDSCPFRSQARGLAEIANKLVQDLIRKYYFPNRMNWVNILPTITQTLNNRLNSQLNVTPHQLLLGRPLLSSKDEDLYKHANQSHVRPSEWRQIEQEIKEFESIEKEIVEKIREIKIKRQKGENKKRRHHTFKVNDYVLVKNRAKVLGVTRKLMDKYLNIPFKVEKVRTYGVFIKNLFDNIIILRHASELKKVKTSDAIDFNLPNEVIHLMGQVTLRDMDNWFEDLLHDDKDVKIRTRSTPKQPIGSDLYFDYVQPSDSDDEDDPTPKKKVRFDL